MKFNIFENPKLENLLTAKPLSLEEEANTSTAVAEYLSNIDNSTIEKINSLEEEYVISINDSLLKGVNLNLSKYSIDEFHNLIDNERKINNPANHFPRITKINEIFMLINNLPTKKVFNKKILFESENVKKYDELINAICFFGYFEHVDEKFYIATKQFEQFIKLSNNERYIQFVIDITKNYSVHSAIAVQLFSPSYDRITKEVIRNRITDDPNMLEEKISESDLIKIINNFRIWFLDIKKSLIN